MGKQLDKVELSAAEKATLEKLINKGKHAARKVKRAQILLHLDKGKQPRAIAEAVGLSLATVYNVHGRFLKDRLGALEEKPRPGQPRKVTPEVEAAVTRIACSQAPDGHARWTVSLINEEIVELGYQVHDESVRLILKKASSSPGSKSSGASAR
ncbi:helix-turn-helix domain-containing protein [Pontibacter sp. E15-1]|uniref:helix-turn-helix domain-containing protein n=1 Tax=Pontibacter sp. E15-1 TaxID=2919918 RepID=UPI001F4F2CD0|nr:helix-turn-helix domain-containing protein [Pontibacter sp. E15-1]MCJ8164070.1 helix-turn-helix domain-containing protein [Pontibacter sp. E15-1]